VALVHLESISNLILWQYRKEMGSIWDLLRVSRFYSRFFVSATSTVMSIQSLMFGNDAVQDHLSLYSGSAADRRRLPITHMTAGFKARGYDYRHFSLDNIAPQLHEGKPAPPYFTCSSDQVRLFAMCEQWLTEIGRSGMNFFLFLTDDITHMASDGAVKRQAATFSERFRAAYRHLDATVGILVRLLSDHGLLENTLVVCYGDHGDELWSHALTRGFCHGIAPYASQAWTPLFVYDNGRNAGVSGELTSITDLREMLVRMAFPDEAEKIMKQPRSFPFSGIDTGRQKRELAFSQNLYALQLEHSDLEKALTKGYAVTDGVYRLVASSGGKRPKDGGLELYYDRLDPMNSRNLLDFFTLGNNGDIVGFRPPPAAAGKAFDTLFSPETVHDIMDSYHRLKRELHDYVRAKEAEALKRNGGEYHLMPENAFRFARKRLRQDYTE
jgi:hypothetical protein